MNLCATSELPLIGHEILQHFSRPPDSGDTQGVDTLQIFIQEAPPGAIWMQRK
jgi:hypothetical protein